MMMMKRMLKVKRGCNVFDEVSVYIRRKGYVSHLKNNNHEKESVFCYRTGLHLDEPCIRVL